MQAGVVAVCLFTVISIYGKNLASKQHALLRPFNYATVLRASWKNSAYVGAGVYACGCGLVVRQARQTGGWMDGWTDGRADGPDRPTVV